MKETSFFPVCTPFVTKISSFGTARAGVNKAAKSDDFEGKKWSEDETLEQFYYVIKNVA